MGKAKSDKNDDDRNGESGAETNKGSRSDKDESSNSDSSSELEPVRTKKGEPPDNLRRRAEWFQKRSSGG